MHIWHFINCIYIFVRPSFE